MDVTSRRNQERLVLLGLFRIGVSLIKQRNMEDELWFSHWRTEQ